MQMLTSNLAYGLGVNWIYLPGDVLGAILLIAIIKYGLDLLKKARGQHSRE